MPFKVWLIPQHCGPALVKGGMVNGFGCGWWCSWSMGIVGSMVGANLVLRQDNQWYSGNGVSEELAAVVLAAAATMAAAAATACDCHCHSCEDGLGHSQSRKPWLPLFYSSSVSHDSS